MPAPPKTSLKDWLNSAQAAASSGDTKAALSAYRQILAKYPKHTGAKKALKKLEKVAPDGSAGIPADQANRLMTLVNKGQFASALKLAGQLSQNHPKEAGLFNIIGFCHTQSGANDAALASFGRALDINPGLVEALSNMGSLLVQLERPKEAVEPLQKAVKQRPDYAEAHHNLGIAYAALKLVPQAQAAFDQAIKLVPNYVNALNSRAMLKAKTEQFAAALVDYQSILAVQPNDIDTRFNVADMLVQLGRNEEALDGFNLILELQPGHLAARKRIVVQLITTGRAKQAVSHLKKILAENPDDCTALRAIAQHQTNVADDPMLDHMKQLFDRPEATDLEQINLGFGLAKACGDTDQMEESFAYYKRANDLNYRLLSSDADEKYARIETSRKVFTPEFVKRFSQSGSNSKTPIFIVGMPRSGTTLVEQILASHSSVYGAGELMAAEHHSKAIYEDLAGLTSKELEDFAGNYLARLTYNSGDHARVTDKMPGNFHHVGLLKLAFPEAKIINLVRDPRDTCLSIYQQYFDNSAHRYAYDLVSLAKFANSYKSLMGFWHALFPGQIYDAVYENLTTNQESESRRLLEFCGLDWQDQVLDFHKTKRVVRTASVTQVRRKMYRSSVRKWEVFAEQLEPLTSALDQVLWKNYFE
ncbi:MAG: tetratricopeptide repeat protein [Rhodobacteraceae bacterium]|nr:tetratricopeptide repeat protein [Paracoccaceae bacterium]